MARKIKPLTADEPVKKRAKKGVVVSGTKTGTRNIPIECEERPPEDLILEVIRRAEAMGLPKRSMEFTDPQKMAKSLWLYGQMMPINRIYKMTGIDRNTLRRMVYRHDDTIQKLRQKFARKFAMLAESTADLLQEKIDRLADNPDELDKISPDRLAVTLGVVTDKGAMLDGMATVHIEHRKGPSIDDAAAMIAAAKARVAAKLRVQSIDAEVIGE